jgi:hypothetical protein
MPGAFDGKFNGKISSEKVSMYDLCKFMILIHDFHRKCLIEKDSQSKRLSNRLFVTFILVLNSSAIYILMTELKKKLCFSATAVELHTTLNFPMI